MLPKAFDYKRWADERTLHAIEAIDKDLRPDSYEFALQQINHMVIVEELFTSRLTGASAPHTKTNTELIPGFDELARRLDKSNEWYADFVTGLTIPTEQISFVFADGKRGLLSVEEVLFHILNHGSYHRGNIAHALDNASVPHPIDGYGIYIHEREPHRRET
ncbi:MAG: DinB family protein [Halieaceae bacterium]